MQWRSNYPPRRFVRRKIWLPHLQKFANADRVCVVGAQGLEPCSAPFASRGVAKYGLVSPCLEAQGEIVETDVERSVFALELCKQFLDLGPLCLIWRCR